MKIWMYSNIFWSYGTLTFTGILLKTQRIENLMQKCIYLLRRKQGSNEEKVTDLSCDSDNVIHYNALQPTLRVVVTLIRSKIGLFGSPIAWTVFQLFAVPLCGKLYSVNTVNLFGLPSSLSLGLFTVSWNCFRLFLHYLLVVRFS